MLDTDGDGLLVLAVGAADLRITRRVALLGGPSGLALDRRRARAWVTLPGRNELVALRAGRRPHVLVRRPTVRQADRVAVEPRRGGVVVMGSQDGRRVVELVGPAAAGAPASRPAARR